MFSEGVAGLGVEETLDAVGVWHARQVASETRVFVAAAHFADLHHPDTRAGRDRRELPGTEKALRLGGVGTPKVLEFAAALFGPRIGISAYSAGRLMPTRWTPAIGCRGSGLGCAPGRCRCATPGTWPGRPATCPWRRRGSSTRPS